MRLVDVLRQSALCQLRRLHLLFSRIKEILALWHDCQFGGVCVCQTPFCCRCGVLQRFFGSLDVIASAWRLKQRVVHLLLEVDLKLLELQVELLNMVGYPCKSFVVDGLGLRYRFDCDVQAILIIWDALFKLTFNLWLRFGNVAL